MSQNAAPVPFPFLPTVLVVDDSGYSRLRVKRLLLAEGWTKVLEAADGDEALEVFQKENPGLVLIDQVMRGKDGIEVSRLIHAQDPNVRVAILTVLSDPEIHFRAKGAGVFAVVNKSDPEALRLLLKNEKARSMQ